MTPIARIYGRGNAFIREIREIRGFTTVVWVLLCENNSVAFFGTGLSGLVKNYVLIF